MKWPTSSWFLGSSVAEGVGTQAAKLPEHARLAARGGDNAQPRRQLVEAR